MQVKGKTFIGSDLGGSVEITPEDMAIALAERDGCEQAKFFEAFQTALLAACGDSMYKFGLQLWDITSHLSIEGEAFFTFLHRETDLGVRESRSIIENLQEMLREAHEENKTLRTIIINSRNPNLSDIPPKG